MLVYLYVNKINGKYYVGKTKSHSLESYFRNDLRKAFDVNPHTSKPHLYAAIRKYGPENFACYSVMSTLASNEQLCQWERFLISLFRSQDPNIGYNIAPGGESSPTEGTRLSAEHRQKISDANKGCRHPFFGRTHSAATRLRMSQSHKSSKVAQAHRKQLQENQRVLSEEHKQHIRDGMKAHFRGL